MKKIKLMLCLVITTLFGCSDTTDVLQKEMREKNPTSYVFQFPRAAIIKAIINGMENAADNKLPNTYYIKAGWYNEGSITGYLSKDTLAFLKNEDYFHVKPKLPYSKQYLSVNGAPLQYYAQYLILLRPINFNSTKVEVLTVYNKLLMGESGQTKCFDFIGFPFPKAPITRIVEPSTIEEYEILLSIGALLGVKDSMPGIKLPDSKLIYLKQ